jgi:Gas vesicle protein
MMSAVPSGGGAMVPSGAVSVPGSDASSNLGEVLERVLDKGIVIAGDIQINLLDIELLTIKLRLIVASVETARRMGISWWESDPWLTEAEDDPRSLRERLTAVERQLEQGGERSPAENG